MHSIPGAETNYKIHDNIQSNYDKIYISSGIEDNCHFNGGARTDDKCEVRCRPGYFFPPIIKDVFVENVDWKGGGTKNFPDSSTSEFQAKYQQ